MMSAANVSTPEIAAVDAEPYALSVAVESGGITTPDTLSSD